MMLLALVFSIVLFTVVLKIYLKLSSKRCKSKKCLVGKTVIITGANTGIGYATALEFAKRGARVILACRDEARAENARAKIVEETENENVVVRLIDLSSFKSVRAFAKRINEEEGRLDILVNNAAAAGIEDMKSEDGHLLMMQINHFSPFLLTVLLIGLIKKKKGRIVNVSSKAAKWIRNFNVKDIDKFQGVHYTYCCSKLCNILFTIELAKKLKGTGTSTFSLNPGATKTDITRKATGFEKVTFAILNYLFFKTCEEGAQTTIYCCLEKGLEVHNGENFDNCRIDPRYKTASDPELSKKLWELTENIVQLKTKDLQL